MHIQTKNCLWARSVPLHNVWKVSFIQRKREVLRGLFKAMPQQPLYADTLSCGESFHFCLYLGADIVPCGGSTCDLWPSNLCSLTRYVWPHFVRHAAHDLVSSDQGICTGGKFKFTCNLPTWWMLTVFMYRHWNGRSNLAEEIQFLKFLLIQLCGQ